jgi:hypothetical protein
MSRILNLLLVLALLTAGVAPAWSQMALPPPVPPGVAPAWAVVPTSPKVFYAPNVPGDLFLLHKRYYYYYGGYWYQSKYPAGPWGLVQKKLPPALYRVNRSYFKTPPPW